MMIDDDNDDDDHSRSMGLMTSVCASLVNTTAPPMSMIATKMVMIIE